MTPDDRIFLSDLRIEAIIGIYDWEREIKQTLSIDLEMAADVAAAARTDHIDSTLNYKAVAKRLIQYVGESEFQLVETLAERIAGIVLDEFGVRWVKVRLNKPGAVRGSRDVGIQVIRQKPAPAAAEEVYVSVGSNVEPEQNLGFAMRELETRFGPVARSRVYRNRAVGFDGDDFLNIVAAFRTSSSPREISVALREVEAAAGRKRTDAKFGPRTLDIDLLLYGNQHIDEGDICLPRREIRQYAFMLKPLAELAGYRVDPATGESYAEMWRSAACRDHPMQVENIELPI